MIDENAAPIPIANVDIVSLSPTAEQYFLFSRVDGKLTVEQLCQTSGLGRESTLNCLKYLANAGAVEIPGFKSADSLDIAPGDVDKDDLDKNRVTPNYPIPPDAFEYDPELLALEAPLDDTARRELICLYEQLDAMSYYDLFGLSMEAKRKEIKKAYFRLSKRYHPDNFFRQDLGQLGVMQETIFKEIARAYQTLSKKSSRKEYDTALSTHLAENPSEGSQDTPAQESQKALRERNKRKAVGTLLVRRAEKLEERGDYSRAAEEYRKALALTRDPELALRVANILLTVATMPQEAASFARAALKLGASVAAARFILGGAMQAVGAESAAIQEYRKVLADSPGHPGATERLGELEPT